MFLRKKKNIETIKSNEPKLTKEERREKEIRERMAIIDNFKLRGSETVKEYISLKKELEEITYNRRFSEWFSKNKEVLTELFDTLFDAFVNRGEKVVCLFGEQEENEYFILYGGRRIQKGFLEEVLKRYGYYVTWWYSFTSKKGIRVLYRKEDI